MAMYEDSYEERQENEVEFLLFAFPEDSRDLRLDDPWKIKRPPEIILTLAPQKSMGGSREQRPVSIKLHAKYPVDYPDTPPEFKLEDAQGLSEDLVKQLLEEIEKMSKDAVGEVMMLDIAQHVQAFLHRHDRPAVSLYEEMMKRQKEQQIEEKKKLEAEREKWRMKEEEEHRQIQEEIQRKQAELRERISHSEEDSEESEDSVERASSDVFYSSEPGASGLTLTGVVEMVGGVVNKQLEAGSGKSGGGVSQKGEEPQVAQEIHIQRGKSLGESTAGGHTVYVGLEAESGDLLAIYEWVLQCRTGRRGDNRRMKQVASIQQEFESYQQRSIRHTNLVQYLSMTHGFHDNKITVEVVMEYVGGGNVSSLIRNPDCGAVRGETLRYYSKQLLEAVSYLHSQGIVHNDIKPSLVFFDAGGSIKLGGFSIIKRLSDLHRAMSSHARSSVTTPTEEEPLPWLRGIVEMRGGKKGDILKLGMIILCLAIGKLDVRYPPTIPNDLPDTLRDFLTKCLDTNEYCRLPAHELLHHPFINPSPQPSQPLSFASSVGKMMTKPLSVPASLNRRGSMQFQRSDSLVGSPLKPYLLGRSRLETEFEELETLGSGGFGDVIKVRNHLDGRLYALKKISIRSGSRMMARITKEVELLSQMNHENVVRYYNAWIETYSEEELKRYSGAENMEDLFEEDSSESEEEIEEEENPADMLNSTVSVSSESDYSSSSSLLDNHQFSDSDSSYITFEASGVSIVVDKTEEMVGSSKGDCDEEVKVEVDEEVEEEVEEEEVEEEVEDGVFANEFSSSSTEQYNFLGALESEVMDLSIPRPRISTAESSDTVLFMDSGSVLSKPIPIKTFDNKNRRDKRKDHSSGKLQFLYIQMEFCENQTLRQLIDSNELYLNEDRCWRLLRQIIEGLEHIHSKGMIHRDLKPGNVFLNSSGNIKIGDFGLATFHKHTSLSKSSSTMGLNCSVMDQTQDGDTVVGTALYLAPELLNPTVKYSQKVDIYGVGIIFFEMCHPPPSTAMERQKLLSDIRNKEIIFPPTFPLDKKDKQAKVIRLMLNHNPHERPTSKQLLQSPLLPLKMEDEELQEVLLRTLQATNSTRYRHLIDELFAQRGSTASEFSYFMDLQDSKRSSQKGKFSFCYTLLQQMAHSKMAMIFSRHGASCLQPPLLGLQSALDSETGSVAHFMDRGGSIVSLPYDHRVPFARYVSLQDITYLKRYAISKVYRESKIVGSHPRESFECVFDIVSPSSGSLIPNAEVMSIVSEIISELPGLQGVQYSVWVNHTSLMSSILNHCSIPKEKHTEVCSVLYKITMGALKSSELEKRLKEKHISLSPLALRTLKSLTCSEIPLEEAEIHLETLLKGKSNIGSLTGQALQEISTIVSHFKLFGAKEQVYLHPGLAPNLHQFSGVFFHYVSNSPAQISSRRKRRVRKVPLAVGGRYDELLSSFRHPGTQPQSPGVSVVGVSVVEEVVMTSILSAYQHGSCAITKCSVLICWLGHESLQRECIQLIQELWGQGISADLLYESLELDSIEDIQEFCRKNFIPHIAILSDKTLFYERKQVKVRTLESGKFTEKVMTIAELTETLQQKHGLERSDSQEAGQTSAKTGSSIGSETQSNSLPSVNVSIVPTGKLSAHMKRRFHDQALTKLIPLLKTFSSKIPIEVLVVDLKADVLCLVAAEINKYIGSWETKEVQDLSPVLKTLTECHNKKYIAKICDAIQELLNKRPRTPVLFLYSHTAEYCQTITHSIESLST